MSGNLNEVKESDKLHVNRMVKDLEGKAYEELLRGVD